MEEAINFEELNRNAFTSAASASVSKKISYRKNRAKLIETH